MAQHWFETLLRHDGRDVPEWSRKELAQALQSEAAPPNRRASAEAHDERMNWNRARELRRRVHAGEKLSEEEQEYLQRARQLRRNLARTAQSRGQRDPTTSTELVPLTDMTAEQRYKGRAGLYGDGRSEPRRISKRLSARPAGSTAAEGQPAEDGKIVLISNGMSNTTQEFQAFLRLANDDPNKSPSLVIVDGAQGG